MSSNRPITPKQARGCTSMKYSIATTRSISSHSIEQANISIPDTNNILYIRSLSILEAYLDASIDCLTLNRSFDSIDTSVSTIEPIWVTPSSTPVYRYPSNNPNSILTTLG